MASSDRLLAVTTLSFDIAVLELLLPLTVGAKLVIASRTARPSDAAPRTNASQRSSRTSSIPDPSGRNTSTSARSIGWTMPHCAATVTSSHGWWPC